MGKVCLSVKTTIIVDTDLSSPDEIMEHINFDGVESDEDGVELLDVPQVEEYYITSNQ